MWKGKQKKKPGEKPCEKEQLFELLIHDLTGPLSVISVSTAGLLEATDRNGPLTERQKSTLDRILRNVNRSQVLLHEMIEILRSEEGLFRKEPFPVEKILKESILLVLEVDSRKTVEKLAREKNMKRFCEMLETYGIFLEITGKYSRSSFSHDPSKVQQILRNLLSNALKHRRNRVDVSIRGDTDLLVSVEDDGPGIPDKDQKSIFQRFVRLKDKEHPYVPGLGLGLSGVKALVEAMGGKITLVSRKGVGTRFSVNIPPLK
ncbi:MAG: HAMP domain-containing histidine kinase [Deltaproteobacteria bacterium]|nr:HAMP domain-containing histidine kinase [Deltaproteobacteria bacterium]